jgi:DNA-binding response OmpR family regulator
VLIANNAQEALEVARKEKPDAITLDILMPNGNGFGALYELRNSPETAGIPVVVVSVVDQTTLGMALGAAEYLIKPVKKDQLINAIDHHVRKKIAEDTNILVVEDDPRTLELLDQSLRAAGYVPHLAHDGSQALSLLNSIRFEAILLDLMMPEMDGFELLKRLKNDEQLCKVPVIVMTAKDLTAEEIELLKRETTAFFQKNGSWKNELLRQLTKAVGRSKHSTNTNGT